MSVGVNPHGLGRRDKRRIVGEKRAGYIGTYVGRRGGHMKITCKRGQHHGKGESIRVGVEEEDSQRHARWVADGLLIVFSSYLFRCMEDLEEGE